MSNNETQSQHKSQFQSPTQPPTYLAKQNPHPRDEQISFEETAHKYTITLENGIPLENYISVTTWIHTLFSKFDADAIIVKMRNSNKWNPQNKYYGKTDDEIKKLWNDNRDLAAQQGTQMHFDIECYYNNIYVKNDSIEFNYFRQFEQDRLSAKELVFDESHSKMVPYRTEWVVFDEEYQFAGSIDMVYECPDTGNLRIYDWKRCKEIKKSNPFANATAKCVDHLPDTNFWHYTLQLIMYKYILERKYNKKVEELCLVCLHPENKNGLYIKIKVPILIDEIIDLFAYRKTQIV